MCKRRCNAIVGILYGGWTPPLSIAVGYGSIRHQHSASMMINFGSIFFFGQVPISFSFFGSFPGLLSKCFVPQLQPKMKNTSKIIVILREGMSMMFKATVLRLTCIFDTMIEMIPSNASYRRNLFHLQKTGRTYSCTQPTESGGERIASLDLNTPSFHRHLSM